MGVSIRKAAETAARGILETGGATVSLSTGEHARRGFAVGLGSQVLTASVDNRTLTLAGVETLIRAWLILWQGGHYGGDYIGAWYSAGELTIELVAVYQDQELAEATARDCDQEAIFDLARRETVWVHPIFRGGPGECPTCGRES